MRILIAEDDEALARFVRQGLEGEHYSVDVMPDGEQARTAATEFEYDVVILDLNLPKLDGVSVLRHLRSKKPSLPVLVLTQRTRVEDRVQCLDTGADDYLAKPFSFSELSARIRALVRRSHLPSESVLVAGDLRLDRVQRLVERAGRRIDLTGKECSLLEYLTLNAGRRVTRSMIIEHVWNVTFDTTTNVVDVYINYLRVVFAATLVSAGHLTYREFLQRIPETTYLASCRLEPMGVNAALQLELKVAFPIIDLLLGGEGKGMASTREITEIEEQILDSVARIICRGLAGAGLGSGLRGSAGTSRSAAADAPSWPASSTSWLRAGSDPLTAALLEVHLSAALMASLRVDKPEAPKPAATPPSASPVPDSAETSQIKLGLLMDVELAVTLPFGSRRLLLREVLDLIPGSVVDLDRQVDEPVDVLLDGRLLARGEVVVLDGNYGVRVTEVAPASL